MMGCTVRCTPIFRLWGHWWARIVLNQSFFLRSGRGPPRGNSGPCDFLALRPRGAKIGKAIKEKREFVSEPDFVEDEKVVQIPKDDKDEPIRADHVREPKVNNILEDFVRFLYVQKSSGGVPYPQN